MNTLPKDPVVHSFYIGGIGHSDKKWLDSLKSILNSKLANGDNTVDIKKLAYYCNQTELVARQYLTYLESNVYYQKKFIIVNGSKEFETIDSIRAASIQERAASENQ